MANLVTAFHFNRSIDEHSDFLLLLRSDIHIKIEAN